MSDDNDVKIAKIEERSESTSRRLAKLEDNQKWGVITILGFVAKSVFDFMSKGGGQ